jgi:hypothetical protein
MPSGMVTLYFPADRDSFVKARGGSMMLRYESLVTSSRRQEAFAWLDFL